MKVVITGASGTIGSALKDFLISKKHDVAVWDRSKTPINNYAAMEYFLRNEQPDILYHLGAANFSDSDEESWAVNYEWTSELAWLTKEMGIKFVFTSSADVFDYRTIGPFNQDSIPDAKDRYGYSKRKAEEKIFQQNPNSFVIRLGWQINGKEGGNNMLSYLEKKAREEGEIRASSKWYPACLFIEDTVSALLRIKDKTPGLYMLDSNRKWDFYEIVKAINKQRNNPWKVIKTDDFTCDRRMKEQRVRIPSLAKKIRVY